MEYQTHIQDEFLYEAHRKHLDIHYVLKGGERIKWSSIVGLAEATPYNTEKDAIFYKGDVCKSEISLTNELFAIMFPYDGHSCQHVDEIANEEIRKVVVKISI